MKVGFARQIIRCQLGVLLLACIGGTTPQADQAQQSSGLTERNVLLGRVLETDSNAPVPGAVITLTAAAGRGFVPGARTPSETRHAMSSDDGYFIFHDMPVGRYSITGQAIGYVNSAAPGRDVDVIAGASVPVFLRLSRFASINGRVIDEQGEPIVGIRVSALRQAQVAGTAAFRQARVEATTDDRGMYRLSSLTAGKYVVGVMVTTTTIPASLALEIAAAADDREAASALSKRLRDGGVDLAHSDGVMVGDWVLQRTGPPSLSTPDDGLLVYPTTYYPGATQPDSVTAIELKAGERRDGIDVVMIPSRTVRLSGVLKGPTGPLANHAVRLIPPTAADQSDAEPLGIATGVTDASGSFTFVGVTPGTYTLSTRAGALSADRSITVADADQSEISLLLTPGPRIAGRLVFENGSVPPLSVSARVVLKPLGARTWGTLGGQPTSDGLFETAGDPPGRYFVIGPSVAGWTLQKVTVAGIVAVDDVIELRQSDVRGVVLSYSNTPSRLAGSVVDADSVASGDVDVIAFPADASLWHEGIFNSRRHRASHVTASGNFEFAVLPPGDYYVAAVRERPAEDWQDPALLKQVSQQATRTTVRSGENQTLTLKKLAQLGR